jgi:hypothetical protein
VEEAVEEVWGLERKEMMVEEMERSDLRKRGVRKRREQKCGRTHKWMRRWRLTGRFMFK